MLMAGGCGIAIGNKVEQPYALAPDGSKQPVFISQVDGYGVGTTQEEAARAAREDAIATAKKMGIEITAINGPTSYSSGGGNFQTTEHRYTATHTYSITGYRVEVPTKLVVEAPAQRPAVREPQQPQIYYSTIDVVGTGATEDEAKEKAFENLAKKTQMLGLAVVSIETPWGAGNMSSPKAGKTPAIYTLWRSYRVGAQMRQGDAAGVPATMPAVKP